MMSLEFLEVVEPDRFAVEPSDLDGAERWARLHELEAQRRRIEAEMAVLLTEAKAAGEGRVDAHRSLPARLRAEFRWSPAEVRARMHAVRLVEQMPEVIEALGPAGSASSRPGCWAKPGRTRVAARSCRLKGSDCWTRPARRRSPGFIAASGVGCCESTGSVRPERPRRRIRAATSR
ncbi:MAG: hypothetical protein R2705_22075 [Ilumatobacteraceae bacterium]